jgi:predicted nucleic acid-binding Zn ribbon protein
MRAPGPIDSFGTILSGLAKRLGLESRLLELRLQRTWREIVGEPIGSHTWPDHIRFKKLHLLVHNSVWMQQLTFLKPALLTKINEAAGSTLITDLALRIGEIPAAESSGRDSEPVAPSSRPNDVALSEASAHAARIHNPELRERLTHVMAKALSRVSG